MDCLTAMLVSVLSYVQMRLVLPSLKGLQPCQVHKVFESLSMESDASARGQLICVLAKRSLRASNFCHLPELATHGSFHDLSKFQEGLRSPLLELFTSADCVHFTLAEVLDPAAPVLDWLGTRTAPLISRASLKMAPEDHASVAWTVSVLTATHRPKQDEVWKRWEHALAMCSSAAEFQAAVANQPSTHAMASGHGRDYCSSTLTTQALIDQIRDHHHDVIDALCQGFARSSRPQAAWS